MAPNNRWPNKLLEVPPLLKILPDKDYRISLKRINTLFFTQSTSKKQPHRLPLKKKSVLILKTSEYRKKNFKAYWISALRIDVRRSLLIPVPKKQMQAHVCAGKKSLNWFFFVCLACIRCLTVFLKKQKNNKKKKKTTFAQFNQKCKGNPNCNKLVGIVCTPPHYILPNKMLFLTGARRSRYSYHEYICSCSHWMLQWRLSF